jgi:stearoyl-CoA desaturase (delta-9 desaturase)
VHKGFWHAHVGWMILKQDTKKVGKADISDLNANPALQLQHRYYLEMALASGLLLPTLVAGLGWGDWLGGCKYFQYCAFVWVGL